VKILLMKDKIEDIKAREILSGVGRPTVEVMVITDNNITSRASVPSGTSKGKHEAYELYDGGSRYRGFGVQRAVKNIEEKIAPAIRGKDITNQFEIDQTLIELDGTPNKSRLGGNAILPVSVACAKAGALCCGLPCFRYLGGIKETRIPVPIATVIAGGKHSTARLDFEDYLYVLRGFKSFSDALEALVETRCTLQSLLEQEYGAIPEVGGALAPPIDESRRAFDVMLQAVDQAGFGGRITLGLDVAANELYVTKDDLYKANGKIITADELLQHYLSLSSQYPLDYIEDPFHEDDFVNPAKLTFMLPDAMIVGDDLYASNPIRIMKGVEDRSTSAILLKINQIGTVSEAYKAADLAIKYKMALTVSLRSHETEDDFIADFAVGVGADQIKLGSPVRGERNVKYNRLLAIEQIVGTCGGFAGKDTG
jgi:enolase